MTENACTWRLVTELCLAIVGALLLAIWAALAWSAPAEAARRNGQPDLVVTHIGVDAGCAGDSISGSVSVTVTNQGSAQAGSFQVALVTDGCLAFPSNQTVTSLGYGSSTVVSFNIGGSWDSCGDCTCQFSATVDANGDVSESDENNNTRVEAYTSALPDLRVLSVNPSVTCLGDGSLQGTVTVNVDNLGCSDAGSVVVRLTSDCGYAFTDQTIHLAQGASQDVVFNYSPDCSTCSCSFTATIDPGDGVCECDAANNSSTSGPSTMYSPDIEVQSSTLAISCASDGLARLSGNVTLVNNGCGHNLTTDIPMQFTLFDNTGCGGTQLLQWTETFTSVNLSSGGGSQVFAITAQNIPGDLCAASTGCQVSVQAEADYSGTICECDGTDNAYCADNMGVDIADLEVTADTLGITCLDDGQVTFAGALTVVNNGCGSNLTINIPLRFTLYDDTGGAGNQVSQWTEIFHGVNMSAGGGTQVFDITPHHITTDLCANSSGCHVSVAAEADYSDTICECNGTENTWVSVQTVNLPNLTVNSVTPSTAPSGAGTVTVNVSNDGCAIVSGAVVQLTADCGLSFSDQTVDLAAGASTTLVFEFAADVSACAFTATVDPTNTICECSGTDNCMSVQSGAITVIKDAIRDDVQDFGFTGDLGAFGLDDDPLDAALPYSRTFLLAPGTYEVTETPIPGDWRLGIIACKDPDSGSTSDLDLGSAIIDLDAGEHVTCTFTNTLPVSVTTTTGTGTATIQSDRGAIRHAAAVSETELPCSIEDGPGLLFPHGFFSFRVNGLTPCASETVTVTIVLPEAIPVGAEYWKCHDGAWLDLTSELGDDDGDKVLTLRLTDGELGDLDGLCDGVIVDGGGPAYRPSPVGGATVHGAEPPSAWMRCIVLLAVLTLATLGTRLLWERI